MNPRRYTFTLPFLVLFFTVAAAISPQIAIAAPPSIGNITPLGCTKGSATEVTISGGALNGKVELISPFRFQATPKASPNTDPGNWRVALTVDSTTPLGVYPIRVRTEDGLSNPFLFVVGQLPIVAEKEDNSRFEIAQAITIPSVVEGQIAGTDIDFFRFSAKKGDRILVGRAVLADRFQR